ncbi:reverse transcriptase domain-containing protein [Tanacetum coccineum]|uniref:Reverse transcriptase domain-containing protein n=1 Tax=Tanacetum coccineum TaxID=301880 RepID=A0ABQ4WUH6_9ASTR
MADNRTMAQLLQAPTEGYEDAIVIPEINANFELKHGLINLVQNKQFFGHDKEDPHAHIRYFNKITSTMRFLDIPSTSIKLMLFPFSLEGSARIWLEKEPPRSILTWDDLVSKFINQFFPPSKTINLHTFYNALNANDQDSLNSAAGGNFLDKMPRECLRIIESKSKTDFENYVKANDVVLRNMQNQGQGSLPSHTVTNPKEDLKGITTRSGIAYKGPTIPTSSPRVVERRTEVTKDMIFPTNNGITKDVQPSVVPVENQYPVSKPDVAPVSAPMPNTKPSIPYPSRRNDEKHCENANEKKEKFYEIFKDMSFEISFMDALTLMPKFASTLKALIGDKEKLSEMARTALNEHCLAVILNKLPKKLGDPDKFLIPCKFPGMDECLALADLGASINLMPFSVWKKLNLPNLTPTCMTLELADRSISRPIGIAKDVNVKVGVFQFPADFVVIDFEPDPRVPLILGRCFLKTSRALIDLYEACEEYSQKVLGFLDVISSGNPTPYYDLIVSNSSPTLTPFGDRDILILEALLNNDPSPPPNQGNYLPEIRKELKICEAKTAISSIDEPPDVELKDLPPHLEYAFLDDNNKLPVIIAKDLSANEKTALIKDLKSQKQAIAWKLSDIKGINPKFCSHKILMEEDYEPAVQHQRRVNPKIYDVIKKEVEKLLDAGLIYPISDSP